MSGCWGGRIAEAATEAKRELAYAVLILKELDTSTLSERDSSLRVG